MDHTSQNVCAIFNKLLLSISNSYRQQINDVFSVGLEVNDLVLSLIYVVDIHRLQLLTGRYFCKKLTKDLIRMTVK